MNTEMQTDFKERDQILTQETTHNRMETQGEDQETGLEREQH